MDPRCGQEETDDRGLGVCRQQVGHQSPRTGQAPTYLANSGDVISLSNFDCSLLDLPVRSSADNASLSYEAFTDRIPPLETKVQVYLVPVAEAKAGKK